MLKIVVGIMGERLVSYGRPAEGKISCLVVGRGQTKPACYSQFENRSRTCVSNPGCSGDIRHLLSALRSFACLVDLVTSMLDFCLRRLRSRGSLRSLRHVENSMSATKLECELEVVTHLSRIQGILLLLLKKTAMSSRPSLRLRP